MGSILIDYLILTIGFGSAFTAIGYEGHARAKGWPVGDLLSGDAPTTKIIAFLLMLTTLVSAFWLYSWWSPIVILLIGSLFGLIGSLLLKSWIQPVIIAGTWLGAATLFVVWY